MSEQVPVIGSDGECLDCRIECHTDGTETLSRAEHTWTRCLLERIRRLKQELIELNRQVKEAVDMNRVYYATIKRLTVKE